MTLCQFFDRDHLARTNQTINRYSKRNVFAFKRCQWNTGRGEKATRFKREVSIQTIGYVPDARGGAFVCEHEDVTKDDEFYVQHYASLCEGVEDAIAEDKEGTNPHVQMTLRSQMTNVKVFRRTTPIWGRKFLKYRGNLLNDQVTKITILEIWQLTPEIHEAFGRHRKVMGWIGEGYKQPAIDALCLEFANAYVGGGSKAFEGHWISYLSFELMTTFYHEARMCRTDLGAVWDHLEHRVMDEVVQRCMISISTRISD